MEEKRCQYGRAVCRHFDEETELYTLAISNKEIRVEQQSSKSI